MQPMQQRLECTLEHLLQRSGHILVLMFDRCVWFAWRTETPNEVVRVEPAELRRAPPPGHLLPFTLVPEVLHVQLETPIRLHVHEVVQLSNIGCAITGQTHDFAFVAESGKTEPLRYRCVD